MRLYEVETGIDEGMLKVCEWGASVEVACCCGVLVRSSIWGQERQSTVSRALLKSRQKSQQRYSHTLTLSTF